MYGGASKMAIGTLDVLVFFEFLASDFKITGQDQKFNIKSCLVPACPG